MTAEAPGPSHEIYFGSILSAALRLELWLLVSPRPAHDGSIGSPVSLFM